MRLPALQARSVARIPLQHDAKENHRCPLDTAREINTVVIVTPFLKLRRHERELRAAIDEIQWHARRDSNP
jgi:hypothetical protein